MIRHLALLLSLAAPAAAQTLPDYIDDRSSPERIVTSLYNAINRQEYLRGWSYFRPDAAPPYQEFRDGYADTASVALRLGEVTSEGAAGSIHSLVPVVLQAIAADGRATVFTGCYRLTQVQPGAQDMPPFRPIQIDGGRLKPSEESFDHATAQCE